MGLESATFISQLDANNPLGTDPKSQGDDHLRLVKSVLKVQFPNFGANAFQVYTDASGNIGIGAAPTAGKLDIRPGGLLGIAVATAAGVSAAAEFAGNGNGVGTGGLLVGQTSAGAGVVINRSTGQLQLGSNNIPHVYVNSDGRVSYGTATPLEQITLTSNIASIASQAYIYANHTGAAISRAGVMMDSVNATLNFLSNNVIRVAIDGLGTLTYGGIEVGYRGIPRVTGGLERGKAYSAPGSFSLPATANAGDTYMVVNRTGGSITITPSGITLINAATGVSGAFTLTNNNFCTIWYDTTTVALVK